jgi:hypothetical protein
MLDTVDIEHLGEAPETWEKVARMLHRFDAANRPAAARAGRVGAPGERFSKTVSTARPRRRPTPDASRPIG